MRPLALLAAGARGLAADLGELLFPPRCPGCGGPRGRRGGPALCPACRAGIARPESPVCAGCGVAAAPAPTEPFCPACRGRHARDAVIAGASYAGAARELVRALKYRADFAAGRAAAHLLAEAALGAGVFADLLVPVPLHGRRLRERGFNQAAVLGRDLARALRVPLVPDALRRVRPTRPLAGLDRGAREREVSGAFAVRRPRAVAGARVLLVDDVLTTGATADGCCRVLKEAGAAWTGVAVAARAYPALARVEPPRHD